MIENMTSRPWGTVAPTSADHQAHVAGQNPAQDGRAKTDSFTSPLPNSNSRRGRTCGQRGLGEIRLSRGSSLSGAKTTPPQAQKQGQHHRAGQKDEWQHRQQGRPGAGAQNRSPPARQRPGRTSGLHWASMCCKGFRRSPSAPHRRTGRGQRKAAWRRRSSGRPNWRCRHAFAHLPGRFASGSNDLSPLSSSSLIRRGLCQRGEPALPPRPATSSRGQQQAARAPPRSSSGAPTNVTISCGIARLITPMIRL